MSPMHAWECDTGCRFSDAWRCARALRLSRVACQCACHDYIHRQRDAIDAAASAGAEVAKSDAPRERQVIEPGDVGTLDEFKR